MPSFIVPESNRIPAFALALLNSFPQSGTGQRLVHKHVLKCANALAHHVEPTVAVAVIKAAMPRPPKWSREIEEAVQKAFSRGNGQMVAAGPVKPPVPTAEEIAIVQRLFNGPDYCEAINSLADLDRELERQAAGMDPATFAVVDAFRTWPESQYIGRALLKIIDRIPAPVLELAFECHQVREALWVLREFKRKFVDSPTENL
jgi:hypothetical protein